MRHLLATALAVALLVPSTARAEEASSSSTALIALGATGIGVGAVTLATTPFCKLDAIRASAQPTCIGLSLGAGGALLVAGIPMLVIGVKRRVPVPVSVAPVAGGGMVTWQGTF